MQSVRRRGRRGNNGGGATVEKIPGSVEEIHVEEFVSHRRGVVC